MRFYSISILQLAILLAMSQPVVAQQDLPTVNPAARGVANVSVRQDGERWVIAGEHNRLTFNREDFSIDVVCGKSTWQMSPSDSADMLVMVDGDSTGVSLESASGCEIEEYYTGFSRGIKIALNGFSAGGDGILDIGLNLFITFETGNDEILFQAMPVEGTSAISQLVWPRGFVPGTIDTSVVPYRQGMLLPSDWPQPAGLVWNVTHSAGLYMPWWGWLHHGDAAMAILETPDDAGCRLEHPAGGPTVLEPRWLHSLGALSYPRKLRMIFLRDAGYIELAKRYRDYVKETGHFVSLREKIARSPRVGKLVGSPVAHLSTVSHTSAESGYYNHEHPERNHRIVTYQQRARDLRNLRKLGFDRLYVHLDGWGYYGYDRLHPDHAPASPEAGGWDGLKMLSEVADSLGFLFAIHDQYRDYYHEAPSFDIRHAVAHQNGSHPDWSRWLGGRQSLICPSLSEGFLRRNHRLIIDHGIKLDGAYLDVFACNPLDECYSPEHPVTRTDCRLYRARCLSLVNAWEGVVSSEEPVDWAIPWLDLVHFSLFGVTHTDSGYEAVGIPVPLFPLVYHDAVFVPWFLNRGSYGVPAEDLTFLHGMLNGGMPYLRPDPDDDELEKVRTLCALHKRVALERMTGHEFLDTSRRVQRSTFSDGTVVRVDFGNDTWQVIPPLVIE
jgi:hypothetical protein